MASAQRMLAAVGVLHRAAWQLKSALRNSVSAAPLRLLYFLHFFTVIAGESSLYVHPDVHCTTKVSNNVIMYQ